MASAQPILERSRLPELDGLRGVLAWWVVIGHLSQAFAWNLWLIDKNTLAVDGFMILSGFVIAMLRLRANETYGLFVARRALRLYPVYLISLAVAALILKMTLAAVAELPTTTATNEIWYNLNAASLENLTVHLGFHLFLVHGLVPNAAYPEAAYAILGPAWSISLEWQFYLLAPALVVCCVRATSWLLVAILVIVGALLAPHFSLAFLGWNLTLFLLGLASYLMAAGKIERRMGWVAIIALCFATLAIRDSLTVIPIAGWIFVLVALISREDSAMAQIGRCLAWKPLVHLGEISYSTYIAHMIVLTPAMLFVSRSELPLAYSIPIASVAMILATYLVSLLLYRWVEAPAIRFGKRLGKPKTAEAGGGS